MRRPSCCQSFLASILKFLNFLQAFVGVSIVIYSIWILEQWYKHGDDFNTGHSNLVLADFPNLPDEWFAYIVMAFGAVMCLFAFAGYVATELINGCCLCFNVLLSSIFILLEAALVGFLVLDKQWEQDLPDDPTGELGKLRLFIEANVGICKWVGLTVVVIQALSLLLTIILRAMVSESEDCDSDDDDCPVRRPLLNPQYAPSHA